MNVTGQLEGRHAIREGYTHDSMGLPIQDQKLYWWEGVRWHGITAMWRMKDTEKGNEADGKRPKVLVPVKKVDHLAR